MAHATRQSSTPTRPSGSRATESRATGSRRTGSPAGTRTRSRAGADDLAAHAEPAGQGLTDEEMARQVTDQTSHDRVAATFFERERGGARSDTEAAKFRDGDQAR